MSQTTKEYLIKMILDDAGFKNLAAATANIKKNMDDLGISMSNSARVIDQQVVKSLNKAGETITTVTSRIKDQGKIFDVTYKTGAQSLLGMTKSFQSVSTSAGIFEGHIGKLISRALLTLPVWEAMRFGLKSIEELFQSSVSFAIEWETTMARIQIVTGATKEQLSGLSSALLNVSEKFGMSTKEVGETANEWLRMGATIDTVIPLLEQTSKLSLMSGKSMEESAKSINVFRSAFKMNTTEISQALDKLIGIQSQSGVSLEVLLEGFDKLGVKGAQVGLSFNTLAGYIAAVNQVSRQTGETIGTQLNMMLNRMGSNAVQAAQNISGISFYLDEAGNSTQTTTSRFRDTNSIIMDLAKSWGHLSNTQQAALAKTLGSQRQVTSIIALLNNFTSAIKASGAALGDSQNDINTILDTPAKKIIILQDAWSKFINSTSITTGIKSSLNVFISLIDTLNAKLEDAQQRWARFFLKVSLVSNPKQAKDLGIDVFKPSTQAEDDEKLNRILNQQKTKIQNAKNLNTTEDTSKQVTSSNQVISSLLSEQQIKSKIADIDEKGILNRKNELQIIQEKLAILGSGITVDGKDLGSQIAALTTKKEQLQVAQEISKLNENNAIIQAQMKADGASELQLAIQKLAYLQQTKASAEEINKQQTVVSTAGITQYKNIQDQILDALVNQQKTMGETTATQIENKIALEDQLGIHLQGVDLLKQQLELYKAISDQQNKTPEERRKELEELIKKKPIQESGFGATIRNNQANQYLTALAEKHGISDETIKSILNPEQSKQAGGKNSLQDELKRGLSDPLGSNIHNLANTISKLAESLNNTRVHGNYNTPHFTAPGANLTANQTLQNYWGNRGVQAPISKGLNNGQPIGVNLGGINVIVSAQNKTELKSKLEETLKELITSHLVKPGTKLNNAIKNVIENF